VAVVTGEKLKSLNSQLDDWRTACLDETDGWLQIYRDGLNYAFNNQLANKKLKDGWDPITANYIFPAMMQELAILSQRYTTVLARPTEDSDSQYADMWQSHLQWLYEEDLNMEEFLLRAALDAKIAGYSVAKTLWEPEPRNGWDIQNKRWIGRLRCALIRPEYFGSDPEAETLDEASYIFTARRAHKEWVKRRWPGHDEEIDAAANEDDAWNDRTQRIYDTIVITDKPDIGPNEGDQARLVSLLTGVKTARLNDDAREGQYVTIEEFHYQDYETRNGETRGDDIPEEELIQKGLAFREGTILRSNETGVALGPNNWPTKDGLTYKEPMYPRGRMILRIGETLLNPDTKDQIYPYERQPFVIGVNHLLPHTWRGLNNVEMARGLQDWVNISIQHLGAAVKHFGDPQWVVEEGAVEGAKTPRKLAQRIKSAAGKIIFVSKGKIDKIRREPAPALSTGVISTFTLMAQELRDQTGIQEVGLGRAQEGQQTKHEIVRLETNTRLRTALSHKLLDQFLVRLWRNIAELAQRNYEPERVLRVIGKRHAPTITEYNQGMADVRFDIQIEAGTKLPFDVEKKRMNLTEAMGILGPLPTLVERYLEASEIMNPEEVIAEWQQMQLQLQQQAQQQEAEGTPNAGTKTNTPSGGNTNTNTTEGA